MPADLELLVIMSVCRVTTRVEFWRVALTYVMTA